MALCELRTLEMRNSAVFHQPRPDTYLSCWSSPQIGHNMAGSYADRDGYFRVWIVEKGFMTSNVANESTSSYSLPTTRRWQFGSTTGTCFIYIHIGG